MDVAFLLTAFVVLMLLVMIYIKLIKLEKHLATESGGLHFADQVEPDELFHKAAKIVAQYDNASASLIQRRLSIGYARSARILDQLCRDGLVSEADGAKPRKVYKDKIRKLLNTKKATSYYTPGVPIR